MSGVATFADIPRRTAAERRRVVPRGKCRHCGEEASIELTLLARPRMGGKTVAMRSRTLCEPCAVDAFLEIGLVLDEWDATS